MGSFGKRVMLSTLKWNLVKWKLYLHSVMRSWAWGPRHIKVMILMIIIIRIFHLLLSIIIINDECLLGLPKVWPRIHPLNLGKSIVVWGNCKRRGWQPPWRVLRRTRERGAGVRKQWRARGQGLRGGWRPGAGGLTAGLQPFMVSCYFVSQSIMGHHWRFFFHFFFY